MCGHINWNLWCWELAEKHFLPIRTLTTNNSLLITKMYIHVAELTDDSQLEQLQVNECTHTSGGIDPQHMYTYKKSWP